MPYHTPPDVRRLNPLARPLHTYTVLDVETTGFNPTTSNLIEIGAVRILNDQVADTYEQLIHIDTPIPEPVTKLTGITNTTLTGMPTEAEAIHQFIQWLPADDIVLAHNAAFDMSFLDTAIQNAHLGDWFGHRFIDTLEMSRRLHPQWKHHRVADLIVRYEIADSEAHRGLADSLQEATLYRIMRREAFGV